MIKYLFNPLSSPGRVSILTYPYLSAGAPVQGEDKGLINNLSLLIFTIMF
jgi:hypothetical protein